MIKINENTKFVIYKGTGGLIHMLCGLTYCIEWCILKSHFLIIDVKNHECFKHYLSEFFTITKFENYSENYNIINNNIKFKGINMRDIENCINVERPNTNAYYITTPIYDINIRVNLDSYNIKDTIKIYAGPGSCKPNKITKYISVKQDIYDMIILKSIHDNYIDNTYIGGHFRNTDIIHDINKFIDKIMNIGNKNNINTLYLATDDSMAYDIIKEKCIGYNIIQYTKPCNGNGKPIHYTETNKYNLILNLLIDIYYLYKSEIFLPSYGSLISAFIIDMKEKKESIYNIL